MKETNGRLDGTGQRACLLASRFNETVVLRLVDGARRALIQHGVADDDIELVWVPGAFELPAAMAAVAGHQRQDLLVVLGAVIRGETPHFEYVAQAACSGIAELARTSGLAVGFGVLTVNTVEQAADRAGGKMGNKGWEAACSALEMASVLARLRAG